MKTDARWKGHELTFETFRPASEDVLTYEPTRSLLCLFGGNKRDRERYIRAFAEYIAESPALAEVALTTKVFSLEPFQNGTFSYAGNSAIRRIWLVEVEFIDDHGTLQRLRGGLLLASLETQNLSLDFVNLLSVKLHFDIHPEGERKTTEVLVGIEPPVFSDLAQKKYASIIETYLRQQGVKLI